MESKAGYWFKGNQILSLKGQHSVPREVNCGVTQGSCLGLFLFIIYLNDLEGFLNSPSIYMDDTIVTTALKDVARLTESFSQELIHRSQWVTVDNVYPNLEGSSLKGHELKTRNLDLQNCGN